MRNSHPHRGGPVAVVPPQTEIELCPDRPEEQSSDALSKALQLCTVKMTALLELPANEVDSGEIYKLSVALSGLIRSGVDLSRWRQEREGVMAQAKDVVFLQLRSGAERHPKLAKQLNKICDELEKLEIVA
jgi:hypothetical protein